MQDIFVILITVRVNFPIISHSMTNITKTRVIDFVEETCDYYIFVVEV